MGQNLYDLVEFGNLKMYPDSELRKEAVMAVGKETGRGLRIVKEKSIHKKDQIVTLTMACYGAVQNPVYEDFCIVTPPVSLGDGIYNFDI